jgi:hypothetical protein
MAGAPLIEKRGWTSASAVIAVVSYLLFCLFWFDTGIRASIPPVPALVPGLLCVLSLGVLCYQRGLPRLFHDKADHRVALFLFIVTVLSRAPLVAVAYGIPSSDAAIHGVMSLHIAEGKHHPVFAYGESYDGSLKAHLSALLTRVTGEPVMSFTAASVLFYGGFVVALFALARTILPRGEAALAAGLAVLSPGFLTAWGVKADGSYVEVLAFGTAVLALGARMLAEPGAGTPRAFWMGLFGGLAFWAHILATYYLLTAVLVIFAVGWSRRLVPRSAPFLGGFLLGSWPAVLWNLTRGGQSFRWWTHDASTLGERVTRTLAQLYGMVVDSLPVLAGWWPMELPPSASAPRVLLILILPVSGLVFAYRERDRLRELRRGRLTPAVLVLLFAFVVVLVFAQSTFGWLSEEPRYLIFAYSVTPIFVASAILWLASRSRITAAVAAVAILALNLYGSGLYFVRAHESDALNREFVRELEELGVRYAYTDFYISYKYNFLSHGRILMTSELGPEQSERYLPYREEIASAEHVALIPRSFRMARRVGLRLDEQGVSYKRKDLLYPVIYDLSQPVRLELLR